MELRQAFATALKTLRHMKHRTQEDFYLVSSRTYISTLERGLKSPTLEKVHDISSVLGVHPATLAILSYMHKDNVNLESILERIRADLSEIG
jgi:transcriptional regulator with XRE-family HTH domain